MTRQYLCIAFLLLAQACTTSVEEKVHLGKYRTGNQVNCQTRTCFGFYEEIEFKPKSTLQITYWKEEKVQTIEKADYTVVKDTLFMVNRSRYDYGNAMRRCLPAEYDSVICNRANELFEAGILDNEIFKIEIENGSIEFEKWTEDEFRTSPKYKGDPMVRWYYKLESN